jgi:cardiolipin-specific phospholipase
MEHWRIAMGNITDFYLIGHSFGGHLMGNYAVAYRQHIKQLLLLSPIGILQRPPGFDYFEDRKQKRAEKARSDGKKSQTMPSMFMTMAKYGWEKKISPFSVARFAGHKRSLKGMDSYAGRRTGGVDNKAKEAIRDYLYQIIMRPGCTEYALMVNFEPGLVCKIPLEHPEKLANPTLPFPVSFIYGDNDWVGDMEGEAPQRVVEANMTGAHGVKCHFLKCPGAGHNLHMDNPIGISNMIINEFL